VLNITGQRTNGLIAQSEPVNAIWQANSQQSITKIIGKAMLVRTHSYETFIAANCQLNDKAQFMTKKDHTWNQAAEGWVDFVRTGKDYFRDCMNNPAAFELIGEIKGQKVLDIACGEGYNTRMLSLKGAHVTGVDNSEILLEHAKQEEYRKPLGITYYQRDASCLDGIPDRSFGVATCFMALMDIQDYELAISEVARILKPDGRFVFSITHPCFEKMNVNGVTIEAQKRYFDKLQETVEWTMGRLTRKFTTTAYHRTLTDYSTALSKNYLLISRMVEPQATEETVRKFPVLKEERKRPQSIIFETVKKVTETSPF